ncbi:P-loop containing nucleoside triphosphate hydrolase protein [Irpex lacteus]|nr:P-loop containing nucleoside triphosphate hydrolase protein [Irpex lacteus]
MPSSKSAKQPPRRRTRKPTRNANSTKPLRSTAPLCDNDILDLTKKLIAQYGWSETQVLQPFQLTGIRAQLEGVDAIIQAPTGAGKTVVAAGPHLSPRSKDTVTIMIVPLIQLAEDLVTTFRDEFKLNAIAVHSANGGLSPLTIKSILAMEYQVLIVSPEMVQSRSFVNRLLRNPSFSRRVLSVVVDEAHCISLWGADFRKKYASLGIVRAFLPRQTPIIAMTATLTGRVRRDIQSKLHFAKGESLFHNEGNDRPNVSIVVRACEHPLNTFADLDFVLPSSIRNPTDIPKTYIYVDNITSGSDVIDHLRTLLEARVSATSPPQYATSTSFQYWHGLIRPFNATLSQEYRNIAMAKFRSGEIRILVCTDAAGMGINVPDVDVVVQWKLPATLSNFIQRAGRAARDRRRRGLAVLLVEPSAYTVDLVSQSAVDGKPKRKRRKKGAGASVTQDSEGQSSKKTRKTRAETAALKEYAVAHGLYRGCSNALHDAPPTGTQPIFNAETTTNEGLVVFVQSVECRRVIWAGIFENDMTQLASHPPIVACCDICVPSLFNKTRPGILRAATLGSPAASPRKGLPDSTAVTLLQAWRIKIFERDHSGSLLCPSAILSNTILLDLASYGPISSETARRVLEARWIWYSVYGDELVEFLKSVPRVYEPLKKNRQPSSNPTPRDPNILPKALHMLMEADSANKHVAVTVEPVTGEWIATASTPVQAILPDTILGFKHCTFDAMGNPTKE